jgi:hypothetical protein
VIKGKEDNRQPESKEDNRQTESHSSDSNGLALFQGREIGE